MMFMFGRRTTTPLSLRKTMAKYWFFVATATTTTRIFCHAFVGSNYRHHGLHLLKQQCRAAAAAAVGGGTILKTKPPLLPPRAAAADGIWRSSSTSIIISPSSTRNPRRLFASLSTDHTDDDSVNPVAVEEEVEVVEFPRWLRLEIIIPVSQRQEATSLVADIINHKSGGYLSQCNMLSDMVTSILIEDLQPTKLFEFIETLQNSIPNIHLTTQTLSNLQQCQVALLQHEQQQSDPKMVLPDTVMSILRITWKDATGTLKQNIPSVPG